VENFHQDSTRKKFQLGCESSAGNYTEIYSGKFPPGFHHEKFQLGCESSAGNYTEIYCGKLFANF
jgi:hypothetical protein